MWIVEIIPSGNYIFTAKKNGPSKITSVTELKIENGQALIEITRLKSKIETSHKNTENLRLKSYIFEFSLPVYSFSSGRIPNVLTHMTKRKHVQHL